MKVNANLHFGESGGAIDRLRVEVANELPLDANPGEFCAIGRRLFYCADIENVPLWLPITQVLNMYRFQTGSPALEWVVNHNLNTNLVVVQIFDMNGVRIAPDKIDCSQKNTVTIKFGAAQAGYAIVLTGNSVGQPEVDYSYEQSFASSTTWTVNHGLGYNPAISCFTVDGFLIMPESITFDSNKMTATVTWTGTTAGIARCV